jgi:hypothetical protein
MRQLFRGLVIAATTAVMPVFVLAADNQEVANEIAQQLRSSGQLKDYKIGVKFQDGTAWLRGRVCDQEQINVALKTVFQTPGVTRVVNGLTISSPGVTTSSRPGTTARFGKVESQPNETPENLAGPIRQISDTVPLDQTGAAQRLERVISGGTRAAKRRVAARPATGRSSTRTRTVPSSFSPAPLRETAATEPSAPPRAVPRTDSTGLPGRPIPIAYTQAVAGAPEMEMPGVEMPGTQIPGGPLPAYVSAGGGVAPARYDQPHLPNYSWPSYAAYPNYATLTYPRQHSPTVWPFIGPFYPYPQVPLGWRKVTLEWDDGWWMLDFEDSAGRGCWCP